VYIILVEILEGWGGGLLLCLKMEISGEEGVGGFHEIPSVVGVWIFSGTTHCNNLILRENTLTSCTDKSMALT